jgi:hypothetical protein
MANNLFQKVLQGVAQGWVSVWPAAKKSCVPAEWHSTPYMFYISTGKASGTLQQCHPGVTDISWGGLLTMDFSQ